MRHITDITTGLRFPAGPIAMPDGSIILVEIERQTLSRVSPNGTVTVVAELGRGPNGAAIGPDGRCYDLRTVYITLSESGRLLPLTLAASRSGPQLSQSLSYA